jgi:predicted nicotinamide N-methyase
MKLYSINGSLIMFQYAGAREVVLLDREPFALQCALLAAAANGLRCMSVEALTDGAFPNVAALKTFQEGLLQKNRKGQQEQLADETPLEKFQEGLLQRGRREGKQGRLADEIPQPTLTAQRFDWNVQPVAYCFDVLVACDVLYEEFSVLPLADVLPRMLRPGAGQRILLADPCRRTPANRAQFLGLLAKKRADLMLVSSHVVNQEFEGASVPVQVVNLKVCEDEETVGMPLCEAVLDV